MCFSSYPGHPNSPIIISHGLSYLKQFVVHAIDSARRVGRLVHPPHVEDVVDVFLSRVVVVKVELDHSLVAISATRELSLYYITVELLLKLIFLRLYSS